MPTPHHTARFGGHDVTFFMRLTAAAAFVAAAFAMQMLPAAAQGNRPPGELPAQQQPAEPERVAIEEIQLTQSHIDAFIATQKEIAPVTAKLKGNAQPSKQMMSQMLSQMEAIANKYGFNDFDDFREVGATIRMVFGRINPESGKYDPDGMIRRQIAAVHGNNKISAKQKLQILRDLQQALTSLPKLAYPANAELVARNYDRLKPLMDR